MNETTTEAEMGQTDRWDKLTDVTNEGCPNLAGKTFLTFEGKRKSE